MSWKILTRRGRHSDRVRKWTGEPGSLAQMIAASQDYQAFVLKYHTEFFRRRKFAPCNGALFFQFPDCWPAVTASVVDYFGRNRTGCFAVQQAFTGPTSPASRPAVPSAAQSTWSTTTPRRTPPLRSPGKCSAPGTPCSQPESSPAPRLPTACRRSAKSPGTPPPPPSASTYHSPSNATPNASPATPTPYQSTPVRPPRGSAAENDVDSAHDER